MGAVHQLRNTVVALAVVVPLGGVGAWAFNPQSGAVLHSVALWRIFGITFEIGLPLLVVLAIVAAVVAMFTTRNSHDR